jgi:hypothetical protein
MKQGLAVYSDACTRAAARAATDDWELVGMNDVFRQHIEALHPSFETLMLCPSFTFGTMPKQLPKAGIYLFSEGLNHLYVGRSNFIRRRLQQQCRISSGHNSAPFAFRLAREQCKLPKATYRKEGSREQVSQVAFFVPVFRAAKQRICEMQVRVVEEPEPMRQALLEMYVALSLSTPYNDFDNH